MISVSAGTPSTNRPSIRSTLVTEDTAVQATEAVTECATEVVTEEVTGWVTEQVTEQVTGQVTEQATQVATEAIRTETLPVISSIYSKRFRD